jgi:hypothetical protein
VRPACRGARRPPCRGRSSCRGRATANAPPGQCSPAWLLSHRVPPRSTPAAQPSKACVRAASPTQGGWS